MLAKSVYVRNTYNNITQRYRTAIARSLSVRISVTHLGIESVLLNIVDPMISCLCCQIEYGALARYDNLSMHHKSYISFAR